MGRSKLIVFETNVPRLMERFQMVVKPSGRGWFAISEAPHLKGTAVSSRCGHGLKVADAVTECALKATGIIEP